MLNKYNYSLTSGANHMPCDLQATCSSANFWAVARWRWLLFSYMAMIMLHTKTNRNLQ